MNDIHVVYERDFSEIEGLQKAYTLQYLILSGAEDAPVCRICVRRIENNICCETAMCDMIHTTQRAQDVLRFFYENGILPCAARECICDLQQQGVL